MEGGVSNIPTKNFTSLVAFEYPINVKPDQYIKLRDIIFNFKIKLNSQKIEPHNVKPATKIANIAILSLLWIILKNLYFSKFK